MVIIFDIIGALLVTLLVAALLLFVFGWRRPGFETREATASLIFLIILLFLPIWALGIWIQPFGPMVADAYWGPFALVGFLLGLLLLALAPVTRERRDTSLDEDAMGAQATRSVSSAGAATIFWIFIGFSVVLIILAYAVPEA